MVRKEPLENIALGALLVGLLCKGYLKESKQRELVEQSRLGRIALGALARSGSEKGFKSLLVSPFVPDGQLVSAHCAGIRIVTHGVS